MKKTLKSMVLTLVSVIMFSGMNLTARAEYFMPDYMGEAFI